MTTAMIDSTERTPSLSAFVPGWTVMKQQIVYLPLGAVHGRTVGHVNERAVCFDGGVILMIDGIGAPRVIRADYPITYGPITREDHERWVVG